MECGVGTEIVYVIYIVNIYNSIQHNWGVSPDSYQFNNISSLSTVIMGIIIGTLRRVDHVERIIVKTQKTHGKFQFGSLQKS
jgi:hypothetical protein